MRLIELVKEHPNDASFLFSNICFIYSSLPANESLTIRSEVVIWFAFLIS